MYYVVDLESRSVICYPEGDRRVFYTEQAARDYSLALQAANPARCINYVSAAHSWNDSLHRLCTVYGKPLELRAV